MVARAFSIHLRGWKPTGTTRSFDFSFAQPPVNSGVSGFRHHLGTAPASRSTHVPLDIVTHQVRSLLALHAVWLPSMLEVTVI